MSSSYMTCTLRFGIQVAVSHDSTDDDDGNGATDGKDEDDGDGAMGNNLDENGNSATGNDDEDNCKGAMDDNVDDDGIGATGNTNLTRTGLCDYDTTGYHHLILAGPDDSSILIMCHLGALALLEEDELPTWLGLGFMTVHTIGHRCQILAGRDDSSIVIMCH